MEFFQEKMTNNETETEIDEIQKWEVKIKGKDLKYKTKNTYDFQH